MRKMVIGIGMAALAAVLLTSCASKEEKTVFIEDGGKMKHDDRVPVEKLWKDPSAVMADYDKIIIADVRTDLQLDKSWIEHSGISAMTGGEDKDLKELAVYMKESFNKAFHTNASRLKLVTEKGPGTLILEMAIVKVVADKPVFAVGTTVGAAIVRPITLCLIPVKSVVSHETHSPTSSYIAIEGKIKDAQTGKNLIYFSNDSYEDPALLDVNKHISLYANVREIIDRWSLLFVEIANQRPLETGKTVKDTKPGKYDYSIIKL